MNEPLTVSQVNAYVKQMVDSDDVLRGLFVRGELSNYKRYPSGHHYFTIKDQESVLRAVMFRSDASKLSFAPADGMSVLAAGRLSVYLRDGQMQLYCSRLLPDGAGALAQAFEELKRRLGEQGLFDAAHKKTLPPFPQRVVLVTSPAGAAVRDMIRIFKSRWPMCTLIIAPVRVQGEEAPGEIAAAIRYANQHDLGDVIITGRGGGSMEDLWAFNDVKVAQAIFASRIPVVSAVGHEPDVTIADYVADVRAATPSNAAELVTPDQVELLGWLGQVDARLMSGVERSFGRMRDRLSLLKKSFANPERLLEGRRQTLDMLVAKLSESFHRISSQSRERFSVSAAKLDALSPLGVLSRGYAVAARADGSVITDAGELAVGDEISVRPARGQLFCVVERVQP